MPNEINYKLLEIPLLARNLAASRTPRLQATAVPEYADAVSGELTRGGWTYDPSSGEPLSAAGQTLPEHLEFWLKTRPHALMPTEKGGDSEADAAWLSGNLTARGQRLKHLERFCGSPAAALIMLNEEAARYGITKPFSTQVGTKPGEKGDSKKPAAGNLSTNPWAVGFRGTDAERDARIASICKTGSKLAEGMAKSAGTSIGRPLRK